MSEVAEINLEKAVSSAKAKVEVAILKEEDKITRIALCNSIDHIGGLYSPEISALLVDDIGEAVNPGLGVSGNFSLVQDMVEVYSSESFADLMSMGLETSTNLILSRRMNFPDFDGERIQQMFDVLAHYKDRHFDLIYDCVQIAVQRWGNEDRFDYVMKGYASDEFRAILRDFNGPVLRGITNGFTTLAGLWMKDLSFKDSLIAKLMGLLECYFDKPEIAGELCDSFDYIIKESNERYIGERTDEQIIRDRNKTARFLISIYRSDDFRSYVSGLKINEVKELATDMAKNAAKTGSFTQIKQVFSDYKEKHT